MREIREILERTGRLYTNDPEDVGHISDFWRRKILDLCALLESAPLDTADALREEREGHASTREALHAAHQAYEAQLVALRSKTEDVERAQERARAAVRLVEEAVPRMRTLNNAMSPDWLRRADEFLGS
jgi:hypothetical protein